MICLGRPEEHPENSGDNLRMLCGHYLERHFPIVGTELR